MDASQPIVGRGNPVSLFDRFRRPGLLREIIYLEVMVLSLVGAFAALCLFLDGRDKPGNLMWGATGIGLIGVAICCSNVLASD